MNTSKPVRQLTDNTKILAYAGQLFINLSRPEQMRIIRIMETMNEKKEEKEHDEYNINS